MSPRTENLGLFHCPPPRFFFLTVRSCKSLLYKLSIKPRTIHYYLNQSSIILQWIFYWFGTGIGIRPSSLHGSTTMYFRMFELWLRVKKAISLPLSICDYHLSAIEPRSRQWWRTTGGASSRYVRTATSTRAATASLPARCRCTSGSRAYRSTASRGATGAHWRSRTCSPARSSCAHSCRRSRSAATCCWTWAPLPTAALCPSSRSACGRSAAGSTSTATPSSARAPGLSRTTVLRRTFGVCAHLTLLIESNKHQVLFLHVLNHHLHTVQSLHSDTGQTIIYSYSCMYCTLYSAQ